MPKKRVSKVYEPGLLGAIYKNLARNARTPRWRRSSFPLLRVEKPTRSHLFASVSDVPGGPKAAARRPDSLKLKKSNECCHNVFCSYVSPDSQNTKRWSRKAGFNICPGPHMNSGVFPKLLASGKTCRMLQSTLLPGKDGGSCRDCEIVAPNARYETRAWKRAFQSTVPLLQALARK